MSLSHPESRRGRLARASRSWGVACLAAVLTLALAAPAGAARRHFPVPSCGWARASQVGSTFGVPVRASKGVWATDIAPVLTCDFYETHPNLAPQGMPLVSIQFRELQRFRTAGFSSVAHLGSCIEGSSCPRPHAPAWMSVQQVNSSADFAFPFVAGVQLRVEDGLNSIVMTVANPNGPLPISDEPGATQSLMRRLLPRFRWR